MKADRPSRTAHFVALGRAVADAGLSHVPDFRDPTARVFLNEKGKRSLAKTRHAAQDGKRAFGLAMARVMADMMALRTAAIDMAVRDAVGAGATQLVILGAGLSHVPDFRDPTARVFLNEKGKRSLAKTRHAAQDGKRAFGLAMARVMADMMALRTAAIDMAVRDAVGAGATQLVILGAGYDGRAWRMPELAGVRVFEVDHPATQGDKRAHQSELPPPIGAVSFVSIDFERESLNAVLERAGHDRSLPTCWIWEGVVMYLTHDAMRATLADIAARSARGSTLIVNYHTLHRRLIARLLFHLIGEPQISAWTPEEMAADLRSAGYVVREDTGMADWNRRFAQGLAKVERGSYMRIAIART